MTTGERHDGERREGEDDLSNYMADLATIQREADPAYGAWKLKQALDNPALDAAIEEAQRIRTAQAREIEHARRRARALLRPPSLLRRLAVKAPRWFRYTLVVVAVIAPAAVVWLFLSSSRGNGAERGAGSGAVAPPVYKEEAGAGGVAPPSKEDAGTAVAPPLYKEDAGVDAGADTGVVRESEPEGVAPPSPQVRKRGSLPLRAPPPLAAPTGTPAAPTALATTPPPPTTADDIMQ